jgi:hypothetical protein
LKIGTGLPAPQIGKNTMTEKISNGSDEIFFFLNDTEKAG